MQIFFHVLSDNRQFICNSVQYTMLYNKTDVIIREVVDEIQDQETERDGQNEEEWRMNQ